MANDRQRRLMQAALDGALSEEERKELFGHLEEDKRSTREFNRLKRVDDVLSTAPMQRAPQRLAATIMARLAASIEAEAKAKMELEHFELDSTQQLIAVAISLVSVVTMPMLIGASWMILHASDHPERLDSAFQQVVASMLVSIDMIDVFLDKAMELASDDPEMALALLSLMPDTLKAMTETIFDNEG